MLHYRDGTQVRVGDRVLFAFTPAVVEQLIEGGDLEQWSIEQPGFMLLCEKYGRVLIEPSSADWEDVAFIRRGVGLPGEGADSPAVK